jgi:ribosomal protein S25
MKLVTPSALVERLKINSSLARAACKFLAEVRYEAQQIDTTNGIAAYLSIYSDDTRSFFLLDIYRRAKLP